LVAGKNFGCGSSREQAPLAIKYSGIAAVIASSFSRIFFRNSINIGLPLVECETEGIEEEDLLEIDFENGKLFNAAKKVRRNFKSLPPIMQRIIDKGGLVNYLKEHKDFG
jgi:3-isopropylmalate/(R)-2-methylmalate dehydratase small subunit